MRHYRLLIFDWDGTLMDSEAAIGACMRRASRDVGLPEPGQAAVRDVIGLSLSEAFEILLQGVTPAQRDRLVERYRIHFRALDADAMPFFPGVRDGLEQLGRAGYLLAVATGKARRGLQSLLDRHGMDGQFAVTRCADEARPKPHPKMLEDILHRTGVEPLEALMVGDTVYDLEMAAGAGMDAVAVSYGAHARDRLERQGARACLAEFSELLEWIHDQRTGGESA